MISKQRHTSEDASGTGVLDGASLETELLLECCFPPAKKGETATVRELLQRDLRWEQLLDVGGKHGVLPLVARHVENAADHDVPEKVESQLRDRSRSVTVRNLQYVEELHTIFDAFEDEGIRAIPFKGPVLAASSFGDISLRAFTDLDVLVHRNDVPAAVDFLENRGYEWTRNAPRLDDSALLGGPVTRPLTCEYALERGEYTVEVRWRIGESGVPFGIGFETLWDRHDAVSVAGMELPALNPTDRLLMLAYHGTKHRWYLLKWVADFAVSVREIDPDWSRLLHRASSTGVERKLLVATALATSLFDLGVPERVERRVRDDDRAEALARTIAAEITEGAPERPSSTDRLLYNLGATDSRSAAVRMLFGRQRLHPSVFEYERLPLPGKFHPLYYPIVPIRLAGEGLVKAVR